MNVIKSQSLGNVVLPLIRIMADADLSWMEREKLSEAVAACHRQWEIMEKEKRILNQQPGACAAQQQTQAGIQLGNLQGPAQQFR